MSVLATLTTRGRLVLLAAAVLLGAGYLWSYPLVGALGLTLGLLVVVELVAVLNAAVPDVRRSVEPLVVVRQGPCEGHLRLTGRAAGGLVRTEAAELVDGVPVPIDLPDRSGTTEVVYPIPTRRRGVLTVGPLRLRRSSLTGMAARAEESGGTVEVRVLPRRTPLHGMAVGHRRSVAGGDDSVEHGGTDLIGLHEYTMGDDLRRLHWATSARTGTLMVREDADPAEPHVSVVLDDRAGSYDEAGEEFEEAVELAAALCREAVDRGNPLRFRETSGRDEIVVPGSSSRLPRREARDVDWLLSEIDTVEAPLAATGRRDLDVVVAVTGSRADLSELVLGLGHATETTVCVVDPRPMVGAGRQGGILVLRGTGSDALARLWDRAVAR